MEYTNNLNRDYLEIKQMFFVPFHLSGWFLGFSSCCCSVPMVRMVNVVVTVTCFVALWSLCFNGLSEVPRDNRED